MRDVCLIPAFNRAEMLWHTLAHIRNAEGAEAIHYVFRFDYKHSPELHEVVRGFPFSHEIAVTARSSYGIGKQSFSLLSGYKYAAGKSGGKVFMIEEDVFVATDFFRWHYAVQAAHPDLFCSIAVANPNRQVPDGAHDDYYLTTDDYCSLGVCFDRRVLIDHVERHCTPGYYVQPSNHCRKHFPHAPFDPTHCEQDGLIRRIQWKQGIAMPIAYPYQAKAYHAGYYGMNRADPPTGTLAQRVSHVSEVCYSDLAMRTFALHQSYYEDSKPVDLNAKAWQTIRLTPLPRGPL